MADDRSYQQRHDSAAETFAGFAPGSDTEETFHSFTRRLGPLGSMAFDVVGDMWSRPQLKRRDRSLLVITTLAAQARQEELVAHTRNGLRFGLTHDEIWEILLHVAAYAGYPAAMASSRRINEAFLAHEGKDTWPDREGATPKSDAERDRDAATIFKTISGGRGGTDPAADLAMLENMLGDVGTITYRWAFGEIWSRPQLSRRDRSIAVISILVWLGAQTELNIHIQAGLAHGLTREEITEVITHLSLYSGIPRAVDAMRTAKATFAKLDEKP